MELAMIKISILAASAALFVALPAFAQAVPPGEQAWGVRAQTCLDRENKALGGVVTTRGQARQYLGLPGQADDARYTIFFAGAETDAVKALRAKCNAEANNAGAPTRVVNAPKK